jgi:hypothetical protein
MCQFFGLVREQQRFISVLYREPAPSFDRSATNRRSPITEDCHACAQSKDR